MNAPALPTTPISSTLQTGTISLCDLPRQTRAIIESVQSPKNEAERELILRLIEFGFLPGEELRVIAHGHPGREPIAIRLGHTTFALRRYEAEFIRVRIVA